MKTKTKTKNKLTLVIAPPPTPPPQMPPDDFSTKALRKQRRNLLSPVERRIKRADYFENRRQRRKGNAHPQAWDAAHCYRPNRKRKYVSKPYNGAILACLA